MPDYGWPFGDEFWKEKMFHLGASGVGQFYYFNPTLKLFGATLAQHATMNSVLQELTAYLLAAPSRNHRRRHTAGSRTEISDGMTHSFSAVVQWLLPTHMRTRRDSGCDGSPAHDVNGQTALRRAVSLH